MASDEMLTVPQAAKRLGMSERYMRRLVAEARIAHHKFGRSVRLDPADIDAFKAETRVEPIDESDVWRDVRLGR